MRKEEEIQSEIIGFLEELPLNDIRYDGWPIWWFIKWRFLRDRVLAPPTPHTNIINSILNNEKVGLKQKFKNNP